MELGQIKFNNEFILLLRFVEFSLSEVREMEILLNNFATGIGIVARVLRPSIEKSKKKSKNSKQRINARFASESFQQTTIIFHWKNFVKRFHKIS